MKTKLDDVDIKQIIVKTCEKLNETPTDSNVRNILNFINQYDVSTILQSIENDEIHDYFSNLYVDNLKNYKEDEEDYSSSTFLKDVIYDDSYKEFKKINRNDWSNWNTTYIYIDSRYQNISNTDRSILDFSIVPKSNVARNQTGNIISYSNLTNITEFEMGEFTIPYISTLNAFREITISFLDLPNNAIDTNENSFHFKFTYEPCTFNNKLVRLKPFQDRFRFNPPIKTLDRLRIQFADPYHPIEFPKERMRPSSIDYSSANGTFTFSEPHNLNNGDIVIIEGLVTANANQNIELLKKINDNRGHIINVTNTTSFYIDVPFNTIINPSLTSLPFIYFQSKRIQFPMKIRYINNEDIF